MNAKVGYMVNLYAAIKTVEKKAERLNVEMNNYAAFLTEEEMAEYIRACERIDARHESKETASV